MLTNDKLAEWDRAHFLHPSTHWAEFARGEAPARIVETGEGVYIRDRDGNRLLDAFAGLYCVNVGYGRREIAEAIAGQAQKLAYYHAYVGHSTEASVTLARMVLERAPRGMKKIYFGLSGSDANETNLKLIWYAMNAEGRPEKKKIISRWRGYHGSGLMSGSLTGLALFHAQFDLPLSPILHTEAPDYYRRPDPAMGEQEFSDWCAAQLRALIEAEGPETVAAFVAEPMLGTGGIVPPPAGYWDKVQAVLAEYDVLLVVDEVITGFGRLGHMFGCERYGLKPDLMTVAKGLTSAYAPLSGSIVGERIWAALEAGTDRHGTFGHGWTYSAHPLGAAAGVANLRLIDELGLVAAAGETGAYLNASMAGALGDHPIVGEVRGEGMLAAVELSPDPAARIAFAPEQKVAPRVVAAMARRGVIARAMPGGDIVGFAPPLSISPEEVDTVVATTRAAVEEVAAEL